MNSSDSKFISDFIHLALVDPECVNESAEYNDVPQEDDGYEDDMCFLDIMLDDAIRRDNKEQIAEIRRDIQRMKTRHRIYRRLNKEQKTVKEFAGI